MSDTSKELRERAGSLDTEARKHSEIAHDLYREASGLRRRADEIAMTEAAAIPVDRRNQTLTDGSPVPPDRSHTQDRGDGQQKDYIVLSDEERGKGFVRPVRHSYVHKPCGVLTTMGLALAETYARDPTFYSGTFCCGCRDHFPLDEFVWDGTSEVLGT